MRYTHCLFSVKPQTYFQIYGDSTSVLAMIEVLNRKALPGKNQACCLIFLLLSWCRNNITDWKMDATDQRLYLLPSRATKRTLFWATTILTRYLKLLQTSVIKEHQKQQKTPTTIRCFFEITPIPLVRKIFALAWLIKFCFSIKNRKNDAFLYSFAIEFRCNFFAGQDWTMIL